MCQQWLCCHIKNLAILFSIEFSFKSAKWPSTRWLLKLAQDETGTGYPGKCLKHARHAGSNKLNLRHDETGLCES